MLLCSYKNRAPERIPVLPKGAIYYDRFHLSMAVVLSRLCLDSKSRLSTSFKAPSKTFY